MLAIPSKDSLMEWFHYHFSKKQGYFREIKGAIILSSGAPHSWQFKESSTMPGTSIGG